ncbi:MAG: GMC family oxidoreductase N-terminal domain-containing protein [Proteobacteria bacterium]|nr:GMC family oxidoreductase N-terminal domain-containing protein [Pseudomonadota bacterium]MBI3496333.1 GMC family oxidoreductase N-terminal domain-containing protein [Pseudomonadota bacterium]
MDFDTIIVGAGSAGCVLAARLSEDPSHRVLLLEAGPEDRNPWIHIPLGYAKTIRDPSVNWMYTSAPEPGTDNRALALPRGRVLGGSSSINGHGFTRGQASDYDSWAQMGNRGWSFDEVLPYFRKLECFEGGADAYRGGDGPFRVSRVKDRPVVCEALLAAAERHGVRRNSDQNGADQEGIDYFQRSISRGRRVSTARAYLKPARGRSNLRVETGALTERVLFEARRAVGVAYRQGSERRQARVSRQVILAAGAVGSPQLLELSGIGQADRLRSLGLAVVHDLPGVGENLQDHYLARLTWRLTRRVSFNERTRGLRLFGEALKYLVFRRGVLDVCAAQLCAFIRSRSELDAPDLELTMTPWSFDGGRIGRLEREPGMSMAAFQLRPESRGSIHITAADPAVPPAILPNYLAAETDRRVLVAAVRIGRRIAQASELDGFRGPETNPGPGVDSDAEIVDYARRTGLSVGHLACTCRMGLDPMAVVDPELRLHGIAGLRVVDASVMPSMMSGHTNAPTIMIAEKAADLIKASMRA